MYFVKPDGYAEQFEVYCDNAVDSGGWTVSLQSMIAVIQNTSKLALVAYS